MAKRRTNRAVERAKFKAEKASSMRAPGDKSRYARKKRGELLVVPDPSRRPSWFVRFGWAALAEKVARDASDRAAASEPSRGRAAA